MSELWQPARYQYHTGIDYDIHNPYTDAFNNMMVRNWVGTAGIGATSPNQKDYMKVL